MKKMLLVGTILLSSIIGFSQEYIQELNSQNKKDSVLTKFLKNGRIKGLTLLVSVIYDESEYTEGTSAKFVVYNPTQKTIKYLWFTVVGFNPVGDKVIDRVKGVSNITLKGVGPIEKDESGTYEFDYVWFTDMVETFKIISIKVQYMDNTIKTISNVKEITFTDDMLNSLKNDE